MNDPHTHQDPAGEEEKHETIDEAQQTNTAELLQQSNLGAGDGTEPQPNNEEEQKIEISKKPKTSLSTKLGITHPLMHSRTEHCQHEFGCIENTIKGTLRSFAIGYGIKASIGLIGLVVGFRKLIKE